MIAVPTTMPSADLQQGTAEGGDDDALAAGAEGHAHANLTRSPGDGKRQHGEDPGQRQDQGDGGQHDRDAQPQPHHPQDVAVGLVGALHADEPQGWIDGVAASRTCGASVIGSPPRTCTIM